MNIDREDCLSTAKELIGFLEKSPTCFHAVQSIADLSLIHISSPD